MLLKAFHQRFNVKHNQSCPHCGVGQISITVGSECAYCQAIVTAVRPDEFGYDYAYLEKEKVDF